MDKKTPTLAEQFMDLMGYIKAHQHQMFDTRKEYVKAFAATKPEVKEYEDAVIGQIRHLSVLIRQAMHNYKWFNDRVMKPEFSGEQRFQDALDHWWHNHHTTGKELCVAPRSDHDLAKYSFDCILAEWMMKHDMLPRK